MSDIGDQQRPVNLEQPAATTPPPQQQPSPATGSSFDFNRPTIVSLLYLSSFVLGITAIVGVVLAYVWKNEAQEPWEASHYAYLIRTFWLALIGSVVGVILTIVLIGLFILIGVAVLVVVRSVLSLINAQKKEPMPNPDSWVV